PRVVEQDVQMVERVLVKQVRLVNQKHRMDALFGAFLDMARDGIEQGTCSGRGRQAERDAELAIEVTPAECGVVVVGQPEACGRNAMAQRAQDTRLTDARLTDDDDGGAFVERLEERIDDELRGRR